MDCIDRINKPEVQPAALPEQAPSIDQLLDEAIITLLNLETFYLYGNISQKRRIISPMFPEKLTFDGYQLQASHINEAARLIYTLAEL